VAAQRELELPVRMGIGTGEAELRGADYFGAVLNRVGRVMAAGHGGQVLLADSTAGLLSGVDLVDLGPRRLRDLPTPVGVFQVRAAGLRTEFPALRALDASPGNLRAATNSLIGRESEVAELQAAVKAHRLVTLTGVGGVGKTRLALEIAGRLAVHIGGFLYLSNAKLRNADGAALSLNGSKITCVVFARGLEADGAVQAIGVHIGGQLNLSEAKLRNADGTALTLGDAEITGGVFAGGLEANGAVDANGVHIGGYLYLSEAKLRNAHGNALSLDRAEVAGGVFAGGPE
jgi:hypothetical protein